MLTAAPRVFGLAALVVLAACGGNHPTPTPTVAPTPAVPTAAQLCQLLSAADWIAAGLSGARSPSINSDGPGTGSAYCTYGSSSGASGGLELDVFVGPTLNDAQTTFATIAQSLPPSDPPTLSGIDDGLINTNIDPGFGAILVRAGKLVVTITLPTSGAARDQLTSLAQIVLSRALALE